MRHRTKLATTVALALTISSGIAAVGATTGLLAVGPESSPGTARVIDKKDAGGREAPPVGTPAGTDPGAAAGLGNRAVPGASAGEPAANASVSAPISAPMRATAVTGVASTAPGEDDAEPAPLPTTTTPTTPVVTPPVPALDCHGSDDGMSEAEKQARERACEGAHDDD